MLKSCFKNAKENFKCQIQKFAANRNKKIKISLQNLFSKDFKTSLKLAIVFKKV